MCKLPQQRSMPFPSRAWELCELRGFCPKTNHLCLQQNSYVTWKRNPSSKSCIPSEGKCKPHIYLLYLVMGCFSLASPSQETLRLLFQERRDQTSHTGSETCQTKHISTTNSVKTNPKQPGSPGSMGSSDPKQFIQWFQSRWHRPHDVLDKWGSI